MTKIHTHAKRVAKRVVPSHLLGERSKKSMIRDFAERSNMVYFGYVSQLSDEHRIVRGLTVSNQHKDDYYCIGTYHDYDVVFVERTDTILTKHTHTWHIIEFDLHSKHDLPHMFIGSPKHGLGFHSLLSAKHRAFVPAQLGMTATYPSVFTSHFSIYVNPADALKAEQLIPPEAAKALGDHFKGLVAEVTNDCLYIYSERPHLSPSLLDTMIANGIWLARLLDEKSQQL